MRISEVFKARAFRLALAFSVAVSAATAAVFALIYLQVSRADIQRAGAILVDEAAKSEGDSEATLRQALELRLTRDIRRLDYVALVGRDGALVFGNVPGMPHIPIDGQAHLVQQQLLPNFSGLREPAIFVARQRGDGDVLLLGRSLREAYDLQETLLRALAIALLPTILLSLGISAVFARRATQRFERVNDAIVRIMKGDLDLRLPVTNEDSDIDKVARAVNLMLDKIARLLEQLKNVGDNIAHDLRTPLAVARIKIERALNNESRFENLREAMEAALAQIEKVSMTVSAILRVSAVEQGTRERQFKDFDLAVVCAQVFDFFEPLAEFRSVESASTPAGPFRSAATKTSCAKPSRTWSTMRSSSPLLAVKCLSRPESADGLPIARVSDTGRGVAPEEREKIFRRFYRGEKSGEAPGHGLGLSIAERIANLHGFRLTVEDNEPGARFELRAVRQAAPALEREKA